MAEFMPCGDCSVFFRVVPEGTMHDIYPLDGLEDGWRCLTCGAVFTVSHGFAVCPADWRRAWQS